jgi:hypothetical protein
MRVCMRALKALVLGLLVSAMFPGLMLMGWLLLLPSACAEVGPQLCTQYAPRVAVLYGATVLAPAVAYSICIYRKLPEESLFSILHDELRGLTQRDRIICVSNILGWVAAGASPLLLHRVLGFSASTWVYLATPAACWFGGMFIGFAVADAAEQRSRLGSKLERHPTPAPELVIEAMRAAASWAGMVSGVSVLAMWGLVWPRLTHLWLQRDVLHMSFLTPLPYAVAAAAGVMARYITLQLLVSGVISRRTAIIGTAVGTVLLCLGAILIIEHS